MPSCSWRQATHAAGFCSGDPQHPLGESFGRTIIEIILSFRDKDTPAQTPEEPGPIQWKSIVMESTPDAYRELYLLTNNGMFDRNQSKASLYSVERSQILEVAAYLNEKLNGNVEFREDSYWVWRLTVRGLLTSAQSARKLHKSLHRTVIAQIPAAAWTCRGLSYEALCNAKTRSVMPATTWVG